MNAPPRRVRLNGLPPANAPTLPDSSPTLVLVALKPSVSVVFAGIAPKASVGCVLGGAAPAD